MLIFLAFIPPSQDGIFSNISEIFFDKVKLAEVSNFASKGCLSPTSSVGTPSILENNSISARYASQGAN